MKLCCYLIAHSGIGYFKIPFSLPFARELMSSAIISPLLSIVASTIYPILSTLWFPFHILLFSLVIYSVRFIWEISCHHQLIDLYSLSTSLILIAPSTCYRKINQLSIMLLQFLNQLWNYERRSLLSILRSSWLSLPWS